MPQRPLWHVGGLPERNTSPKLPESLNQFQQEEALKQIYQPQSVPLAPPILNAFPPGPLNKNKEQEITPCGSEKIPCMSCTCSASMALLLYNGQKNNQSLNLSNNNSRTCQILVPLVHQRPSPIGTKRTSQPFSELPKSERSASEQSSKCCPGLSNFCPTSTTRCAEKRFRHPDLFSAQACPRTRSRSTLDVVGKLHMLRHSQTSFGELCRARYTKHRLSMLTVVSSNGELQERGRAGDLRVHRLTCLVTGLWKPSSGGSPCPKIVYKRAPVKGGRGQLSNQLGSVTEV